MALTDLLTSLNGRASAPGIARKPRCKVTVNGQALTGVIEAEVTSNAHFAADTFRVVAASAGMPPGLGPDYWSSSQEDLVAVWMGFEDSLTQHIVGQVDGVEYDPVQRTLTLTGRDLSARLIDARTAEKFQNKKAHEIAQALALRHGLDSDVSATTATAGKYYAVDHVALTQEQTEWDLLCYLASHEGFDCWVSGQTLHFQPPPSETATPYLLLWSEVGGLSANMTSLKLQRSQTLARDVVVKVRSWNQKQQRAFTVTARRSQAFKSQRAGGKSQTYTFTVPNLTPEQAQRYAQRKAAEITRHERTLSAALPGDNLLTTRTPVRLAGTNTDWDQVYYPSSVTRKMSFQEGYAMELSAKNHSPQDETIL